MRERPSVTFCCPICRSQTYLDIGTTQRTRQPIYACAGCSVLFTDPELLTKFQPHTARIAAPNFRSDLKPPRKPGAAAATMPADPTRLARRRCT
jgi:hypothetical protein